MLKNLIFSILASNANGLQEVVVHKPAPSKLAYIPKFASDALFKHDQVLYHHLQQLSAQEEVINLANVKGVYFRGDIYVGTPAQKMTMDFDTGSSVDWLRIKSWCDKT